MANRVNLDAMIPREDFAIQAEEHAMDLLKDFPLHLLSGDSPVLKLLRKPDFQRETNHWTPDQVVTLIASFLDNEVIPSLILWKSPSYIFVIDGGHRLSALRAWMEDDYGDKAISLGFYGGDISDDQKRVAKRTRNLIEKKVGRYSDLRKLVDKKDRRAITAFTRGLNLQWIQSDRAVAETSFYKINSQGTPLDDTERMLIENRRKPIAIGARAIYRSGTGHKYWSSFDSDEVKEKMTARAKELHNLLFEPEAEDPLTTLEVPVAGSVSPVDALSLLVDFLTIAANRSAEMKYIDGYEDDKSGEETVALLSRSVETLRRIVGNSKGSLGLHRAVYFYNENGKHSRFLFLGMVSLIAERLRNNDGQWFKKFTSVRPRVEEFLIENKSLIGIALQNMGKGQRIPKMKELFDFLVDEAFDFKTPLSPEKAIATLGLRGRILDVRAIQTSPKVSDETKSAVMVRTHIKAAVKCPICHGLLDPGKSVSYDHTKAKREHGTGDRDNIEPTHPYCNNSRDSLRSN
jgi:hypothetical protein